MTTSIDYHREEFGDEPTRAVLPIAPSTFYAAWSRPASEPSGTSSAQTRSVASTGPTQLPRLGRPHGVASAAPRRISRVALHRR